MFGQRLGGLDGGGCSRARCVLGTPRPRPAHALQIARAEVPDWVLTTFLSNCMQDTNACQVQSLRAALCSCLDWCVPFAAVAVLCSSCAAPADMRIPDSHLCVTPPCLNLDAPPCTLWHAGRRPAEPAGQAAVCVRGAGVAAPAGLAGRGDARAAVLLHTGQGPIGSAFAEGSSGVLPFLLAQTQPKQPAGDGLHLADPSLPPRVAECGRLQSPLQRLLVPRPAGRPQYLHCHWHKPHAAAGRQRVCQHGTFPAHVPLGSPPLTGAPVHMLHVAGLHHAHQQPVPTLAPVAAGAAPLPTDHGSWRCGAARSPPSRLCRHGRCQLQQQVHCLQAAVVDCSV